MDKLAKLSMESSKVDTSLAKKYLDEHKFENFPIMGELWVYNKDPKEIQKMATTYYEFSQKDEEQCNREISRQLAKIIEQNEMLFCQLEHEIRNTDPADVKNSILLMSQHLQCLSSLRIESPYERGVYLVMCEDSPLHVLGCVAYCLPWKTELAIVTSKATAPLCHLFVELCLQVGWEIPLLLVDNPKEAHFINPVMNVRDVNDSGCTGVVTDQADVDSALDVLIYSSATAPWRFRRVYVQESVYEEFKTGLAWKCDRQLESGDVYKTRGKTFSCDSLRENSPSDISIEAYRTVKELLGLMKRHSAAFLSVWAEGSELSHEIAFGSTADYVWVNEYAAFAGPPLASCPIYSNIYTKQRDPLPNTVASTQWWKLKDDERKDVMVKTLQGLLTGDSKLHDQLMSTALDWQRESFVNVADGRICLGVEMPLDKCSLVYIAVVNDDCLLEVVKYSLRGYIVVYDCYGPAYLKEILGSIENKSDLPILNNIDFVFVEEIKFHKRFKVIQSRFGTVFAN